MNENRTQITSSTFELKNNKYTGAWDPTDSLGHSNTVRYVYSVGIYTPPIEEKIFSETVLYTIVGITVVLLLVALIITKKFKS